MASQARYTSIPSLASLLHPISTIFFRAGHLQHSTTVWLCELWVTHKKSTFQTKLLRPQELSERDRKKFEVLAGAAAAATLGVRSQVPLWVGWGASPPPTTGWACLLSSSIRKVWNVVAVATVSQPFGNEMLLTHCSWAVQACTY